MQYTGISLMVICSMLYSAGQFLFRASVSQGEPPPPASLLRSGKFWGGIGIYVVATVLNIVAFHFGDLTILYPLTSLALVWNLMFARRLFGDAVGIRRIAATAIILVGCIVVVS